jgi:hypothetical protein
LNIAGNNFSYTGQNEQSYENYVIVSLKNLKYLDYVLIDEETRAKAVSKLDGEGGIDNNQGNDKVNDSDKNIDPELIAAKIDCTHNMLEKILAGFDDKEFKDIRLISKFLETWHKFDDAINDPTTKFQSSMKLNHAKKENIIIYCN